MEEARELDIVEEIDPRDILEDVPEQLPQINESNDQGTISYINLQKYLKVSKGCLFYA